MQENHLSALDGPLLDTHNKLLPELTIESYSNVMEQKHSKRLLFGIRLLMNGRSQVLLLLKRDLQPLVQKREQQTQKERQKMEKLEMARLTVPVAGKICKTSLLKVMKSFTTTSLD